MERRWFCVLYVNKIGIKKSLIETSKVQTNMNATPEELAKNPELVKAAVLAEIMRWIEIASFKRQLKSKAGNVLTS